MMKIKKMKKSVAVFAFAMVMLVIGGGFALSNVLGSAMPVIESASGAAENDSVTALNFAPTVIASTTNATAQQAEEADNTPLVTIRPRPVIDGSMPHDEIAAYILRERDEFMAEITGLIPAHLRDMWDVDDAEVQSLLDQNYIGGISPDDFPPYAFWFRAEMLTEIARVADLEAFHFELSRDELAAWVGIARFIDSLSWRGDDANISERLPIGYLEWARETYTEYTVSIYERLNAPQWLIEQLQATIQSI